MRNASASIPVTASVRLIGRDNTSPRPQTAWERERIASPGIQPLPTAEPEWVKLFRWLFVGGLVILALFALAICAIGAAS